MRHAGFATLVVIALLALSGCSSNPEKPAQTPQSNIPPNDSPAHAIQRFKLAYEQKQESIYASMFTKDFVFDFSNSIDPSLAFLYADGWVKNDEIESSTHLFSGYSSTSTILPAAKTISLTFANTSPLDDGSSTDRTTHKILITRIDGWIVVPRGGGDDFNYLIGNNLNAFYLVRGDAATSLDAGQSADSSHWYISRWEDLTVSGASMRTQSLTTSWASIRALYRVDTNPSLALNETPQGAIARLIGSYERKLPNDYANMFTSDYTYEFSNSTDPTLVQQYSTGWFKIDEKESASHLFFGYTLPGGSTLPAASSIDIQLAVGTPTDDNTPGVDPVTHKILATRVDGSVVIPQVPEPVTYSISNNYNVFFLVRGDATTSLDAAQLPDAHHWYVYRWVDLTVGPVQRIGQLASTPHTWGALKALYD